MQKPPPMELAEARQYLDVDPRLGREAVERAHAFARADLDQHLLSASPEQRAELHERVRLLDEARECLLRHAPPPGPFSGGTAPAPGAFRGGVAPQPRPFSGGGGTTPLPAVPISPMMGPGALSGSEAPFGGVPMAAPPTPPSGGKGRLWWILGCAAIVLFVGAALVAGGGVAAWFYYSRDSQAVVAPSPAATGAPTESSSATPGSPGATPGESPVAGGAFPATGEAHPDEETQKKFREAGRNSEGMQEFVHNTDGSIMVVIPDGEVVFGPHAPGEEPKSVAVPSFLMSKYEVTNRQFRLFVDAVQINPGPEWERLAEKAGPDAPACGLSLQLARAYCEWAGLALPSEVQWERAARGDDDRLFPWGSQLVAENAAFNLPSVLPVGSRPAGASPFGIQDMAGNAWEWTAARDPKENFPILKGGAATDGDPAVLEIPIRGQAEGDYDVENGFRTVWNPPADE